MIQQRLNSPGTAHLHSTEKTTGSPPLCPPSTDWTVITIQIFKYDTHVPSYYDSKEVNKASIYLKMS